MYQEHIAELDSEHGLPDFCKGLVLGALGLNEGV